MTLEELSSLRLMLERARRFLERRKAVEAKALHQRVEDAIGAIAMAETRQVVGEDVDYVVARGKSLLVRVRDYAAVTGESFTTCDTPCPERHDTAPYLSRDEIRRAIAAMPPGATEPTGVLAEELAEHQLHEDRHTLLPPEAPTGDLPEDEDSEDAGF